MPNRVPLLLFFSSYVKLQQAYFSESNMAGGWQLIGYSAPNNGSTTNFKYDVGGIAKDASDALGSNQVGWQAANKANLNECTGDGSTFNWTVTLSKETGTSQDDIKFAASAGSNAGCVALTPTFDKIGK